MENNNRLKNYERILPVLEDLTNITSTLLFKFNLPKSATNIVISTKVIRNSCVTDISSQIL
jgi:hypothetical protein